MPGPLDSLLADGKWKEGFSHNALSRGLRYAEDQRVSIKSNGGDIILATCAGSGGNRYQQTISAFTRAGRPGLTCRCSCPVSQSCKHCAAVLFHAQQKLTAGSGQEMPSDLQTWLDGLEKPRADSGAAKPDRQGRGVYYFIRLENGTPFLNVKKGTRQPDGRIQVARLHSIYDLLYEPPKFVMPEDREILLRLNRKPGSYQMSFPLDDPHDGELFQQALDTGRLMIDEDMPPVQPGPSRHGEFRWVRMNNGNYRGDWYDGEEPVGMTLPFQPLYYLSGLTLQAGLLQHDLDPYVALQLTRAPDVPEPLVAQLSHRLSALNQQVPTPTKLQEETIDHLSPAAHLILGSHEFSAYAPKTGRMQRQLQHRAALSFNYDGVRASGTDGKSPTRLVGSTTQHIQRDTQAEQAFRKTLQRWGFKVATRQSKALPETAGELLLLDTDQQWLAFAREGIPALREAGWELEIHDDFAFILQEVDDWYADIEENPSQQWFDLELGIVVNGERHSLLPILLHLLRSNPELLRSGELARRGDDEHLLIDLNRHRHGSAAARVALPYARIKPLMATLGELYLTENDGRSLRLAAPDAARLSNLDEVPLTWLGGERVRDFATRLKSAQYTEVQAPEGLNATLRPYQLEGLSWLQTLRSLDIGGLLGDDMGLGKTLQTLSHVLTEKNAGRLQSPALAVMPTSLIPNWLDEAERFTPQLRVIALHGPGRTKHFANLKDYDLVLSTYALLPRDLEHFTPIDWHLVILDEAQNIKNATSKAAQAARELKATQRLCLTGTPMENNLGELWSIFHFLMPGWLGDSKRFARDYRTPIEKHGDGERMSHLAGRIRPFLLRRTKEQVAKELPAKSEIIHWVDLSDAQRDTYETVRVAMDSKVRAEITRSGAARSQIVILDALLKLRQVCCDLRLVANANVKGPQSDKGKLGSLMDMLDELLNEGRRILLFSQFTSMLTLIEEELQKRKVSYSLLTGDTKDRRTPVQQFQSGETPVFLISLKAGGTGLNLTAADTVIHYDPWWNPATENQATDRAYRIGQDKPVFVYKLITRGTVEEKIQKLQKDKAALAAGLLEGNEAGQWKLAADDIEALFAPLPESKKAK
ncbi:MULTISPECIES: DEAD/DEAH box helicase [unclassified Pseudomonas]|uniref:DEAD/DEAH box helicase n=1 Tax=unclassified Pseudomonas TaxID=196821 RepID=UPI0021C7E7D2|nr:MULTISPECIES: DEAD/DEAH box helicase [unclassified Pseudomonas]MCU1732769.1 DEAD/DEAH box helicase [Pseudomonas sp. 20P_3.2_Bac4]MCU1745076.1 DEAD/DEAH box helicase [Pseudomonas sp. 20P_3.2_Bac5]